MLCKHCNGIGIIFKYGFCRNCFFTRRLMCINNNLCIVCDKQLRPFRTRKDWNSRYIHKSCWKG